MPKRSCSMSWPGESWATRVAPPEALAETRRRGEVASPLPKARKRDSSGEINLSSSQPTLLSRRPEERGLQTSLNEERLARAVEATQSFFWGQSSWAVVYCVCRDRLEMTDNMSEFERMVAGLPFTKKVVECPEGTVRKAVMRNEFMNYPLHRWPEGRASKLAEKLVEKLEGEAP